MSRTPSLFVGAFVLYSFFVETAFAQDPGGDEVGNGGNVIMCEEGTDGSIETLDVYEARVIRDLWINLDTVEGNEFAKARAAIQGLHNLDPDREAFYLKLLAHFPSDMLLLPNEHFPEVKDSNHFPPPVQCTVAQAVIQRRKIYPQDKRYFFNQRLWALWDKNHRAALILHEIIYYDALRHGHTTSEATRYFNSLLFSGEIARLNQDEYSLLIDNLNLQRIRWGDAEVNVEWQLSEKTYEIFEEAVEYCQREQMNIAPIRKLPLNAILNLKKSFIGLFYIEPYPGLEVWASKYAAHHIYKNEDKVLTPQAGARYLVLCYRDRT